MTARAEMDKVKAAIVVAIAPYLEVIAELKQATLTPMHGAYGNLADRALDGTLFLPEASSPHEAAGPRPMASNDMDSGKGAIDKDEDTEASSPPGEAPPPLDEVPPHPFSPAIVPIPETPGEAPRKHRLKTQPAI